MEKLTVPTGECNDCECWLCFCQARWNEAHNTTRDSADLVCLRACQKAMTFALWFLSIFVVLLIVALILRKVYLSAWLGFMSMGMSVTAVIMDFRVPSEGEERGLMSCEFPRDLFAYVGGMLVLGIIIGVMILMSQRMHTSKISNLNKIMGRRTIRRDVAITHMNAGITGNASMGSDV